MKTKLLASALVLIALVGVISWWKLTEVERNLSALERGEDVQAWLVAHQLDERVFAAVNSQVARLVEDPALRHPLTEAQRARLDRYSAFYAVRSASDTFSARVAYGRLRYEPALRWGSERDEGYVAIEALRWLADQPAETIEPTLQWLMPEVLRLQKNRGWVVDAGTLLWARFGTPSGQAFYDSLLPHELPQAVRDVVVMNRLPPEGVKRVYAELIRLRVEPDSRLLEVIGGRYGDRPETVELFGAWGPRAIAALSDAAGARLDAADEVRMKQLLAALGTSAAAPNYVVREFLDNFARDDEPAYQPTLNMLMFCDHPWKAEDVKAVIERLEGMPVEQVLGHWESDSRPSIAHVTARALAKVAPGKLAETLHLKLARFAPAAALVEQNSLTLEQVPEDQATTYRVLSAPVWEAVSAFAELDQVPAPAINVMWEAVESPNGRLADKAAEGLEKRRTTAKFVEGLFVHLSVKEKYEVRELDAVVKRVAAHRDAGPAITKALEDVLRDAQGKPEGVPLVHKYVAFKALAQLKDPKAKATVQKFLEDPTLFVEDKITKKGDGTITHEQQSRAIAELARAAL